jgi:hypothetical protein
MKGKYYGVYDIKHDENCVGVFNSIAEISAFFGGVRLNRIECAITRKNPLAFKSERYWVEVFEEPTTNAIRKMMRQRFGPGMYKICPEGIFIRQNGVRGWRFYAADLEEADAMFN